MGVGLWESAYSSRNPPSRHLIIPPLKLANQDRDRSRPRAYREPNRNSPLTAIVPLVFPVRSFVQPVREHHYIVFAISSRRLVKWLIIMVLNFLCNPSNFLSSSQTFNGISLFSFNFHSLFFSISIFSPT
jgi:hypothetical protein